MRRHIARYVCCLVIGVLMLAGRCGATDGFVLSVRYQSDKLGNIHDASAAGRLMRYDIKDDKVVGSRVLVDKEVVTNACLSPLGDRIAVTRADGTIAVLGIDGGALTELGRFVESEERKADAPAFTGLQWPASEGAKYLYYLDGRKGGVENSLRRVHVETRKDELVVHFNRAVAGGFALSLDATPRSGKFIKRTDNYVIAIHDLARGDGDLYNCPRTFGCGETISPDGSLLTANDGTHTAVALVDMAGEKKNGFRLSQWDGDPCDPALGLPREKLEWAWQHFRWSVNAINWIAVTQGKLKLGSTHEIYFSDAMLYDWVHKKQINVTNNKTGAFDRATGFWETGAKEAFLGYFSGKAPLTVDIDDKRLDADARWDFGDGAPAAAGRTARHAYSKEGSYTLTIRQGDKSFQARIDVQKRRPPTAICHYIDEKTLLIEFSEAVRARDLRVALEGGARVAKTKLNETGRRLLVQLAGPLAGPDRLRLQGVEDLAQEPNALEDKPLPVVPPAWPTNRADLVFLWEDARTLNALYDPATEDVREFRVGRDQGMAGIDRYGRMRLEAGRLSTGFFSQANAQMQFRDLILADAFSLEATIQAADLTQKRADFPVRIVNCSAWHDGDWEFFLGQQGDRLLFSIRTTDNFLSLDGKPIKNDLHGRAPIYEIAQLPDTAPHHVVVSYVPGRLVAYLDGKKAFETKEATGSLKAWGYGELCFGDNHNGGRHQWAGRLEGVAIYKRFLEADEAARNQAAYVKKVQSRKVVPQIEVQVKLLAASKIPELRQIAPYRDALVVGEYEVVKVLSTGKDWRFDGKIEPGRKVRVAQWGLVDGVKTALAQAREGDASRMALEVFTGHPDKLDEMEVSNSLPEDFETPLLYEPRP